MRRFLIILMLFLWCGQAQSDTLPVPGVYPTIQSAINNSNDGDVIIVEPNTYRENINFLGKAIIVRSTDPNDTNIVSSTIIDGNEPDDPNYGSAVIFNSGEDSNSVLSGFTITGGSGSWAQIYWEFKGYLWNRCGGGVLCLNGSSPRITKNVFVDNIAGQGGGIYFYNYSDPIVTNNTFINNSAKKYHGYNNPDPNDSNNHDHGDGGAIVGFHYCDATITNNLIQNNHADYYGGGIHFRQWSNGLIEGNHIADNNSMLGAGLHITYTSSPTIRGNVIERNIAGAFGGGGIYVYFQSEPLVEQNVITKNTSVNGAGMAVYYDSNPVIRNNLIYKNKNGAGIRVRGGSNPLIIHNTIAGNTASSTKGGVDCTENAGPTIENNIICNNGDGYGIYVDGTSSPIIRYNDVWANGAGKYGPSISDQTGINGNISLPPNFVNSDSNDYHLNYNSGCINTGARDFNTPDINDFDFNPRKNGEFVDIGAYEVWPIWNTTSGDKYSQIQTAIDDSNDGDNVIVTAGRYYENINFKGKNIILQSVNPEDWNVVEKTIIDANDSNTVVFFKTGEDSNCVLAGFTITGGRAPGDYGGGVRTSFYFDPNVVPAGPIIRNNIVTNNTARKGAGICLYHSTARVLNNIIYGNKDTETGQGGGIMIIDCLEEPNVMIADNIIVGNKATFGGGIRVQKSPLADITNNVIAYNRATWKGIGIYGESGTNIENCIVWGHGGGAEDDLYVCDSRYSCIESAAAGEGNISSEPNFVDSGYWDDANTAGDLSDDFFVPGNYHLLPGSLCIDAGDTNSVPSILSGDIDGETRVFNNIVDIGADEVVTTPFDLDNDGIVDYYEVFALGNEWLQNGVALETDFYEDGFIDFADFAVLANEWLWQGGWYE